MTRHGRSSIDRLLGASAWGLVVFLAPASVAGALESVASYDGASHLVNKEVGPQRWAIAQNLGDGTVTGNVFVDDGSEPSFVWCEDVTTDGENEGEKIFSCWGASLCPKAPCSVDEWTFLTRVPLSEAFFAPEAGARWESIGGPVTLPLSFFQPPASAAGGARSSGLQVARDGERVLISKDLAGERWAITRNLAEGTVTGNVYFPDGSPPAFVFCDETEVTATDVTLDCRFAADEAPLGPIEDGEGNYFVNQLTGSDDNDGSQAFPFETIEGALATLPQAGGRIYVAGGVYEPINPDPDEEPDQLAIKGRSRVELYGSFDPSTWIRDRDVFPTILDTGRRGIRIRNSAGITIDGFTVRTANAVDPGASSVAVHVFESRLITIRHNTLIVGNGADGVAGKQGAAGQAGSGGKKGQQAAVCVSPRSRAGGAGGDAVGSPKDGRGGDGGKGRTGSGDPGADGAGSDGNGGRGGQSSGQDGKAGSSGVVGESGFGAESLRFGSVSGTDVYGGTAGFGSLGAVGRGGGGGAGGSGNLSTCGGGGGGGGGGGTGGEAGQPGGTGGSSVAVAVGEESDAEITDNLIMTGHGGNGSEGGKGGPGGKGGSGGAGGKKGGVGGKAGGDGGAGGPGGPGGFSGSGAGGSSVGILVDGDPDQTAVVQENNVFELGGPGLGARHDLAPTQTRGENGRAVEYWDLREEQPATF